MELKTELDILVKTHGMEKILENLIEITNDNNHDGEDYLNLLGANLSKTLKVYKERYEDEN